MNNSNGIKKIDIVYVRGHVDFPVEITCDFIGSKSNHPLTDFATITSDSILKKINLRLTKLQTDTSGAVFPRIRCVIYRENRTDTLCMGEFFGVEINGIPYKYDDSLAYLIKSSCLYYDEYPKELIEYLPEYKLIEK